MVFVALDFIQDDHTISMCRRLIVIGVPVLFFVFVLEIQVLINPMYIFMIRIHYHVVVIADFLFSDNYVARYC